MIERKEANMAKYHILREDLGEALVQELDDRKRLLVLNMAIADLYHDGDIVRLWVGEYTDYIEECIKAFCSMDKEEFSALRPRQKGGVSTETWKTYHDFTDNKGTLHVYALDGKGCFCDLWNTTICGDSSPLQPFIMGESGKHESVLGIHCTSENVKSVVYY